MSTQQVPGLYYAASSIHGRGVFCRHALNKGDIIEIAPVLVLDRKVEAWIRESRLHDYYFQWGESGDHFAIGWGYASLYNHSYQPNADFTPDYQQLLIAFEALGTIPAGSEITIDYHAGLQGRPVWFEVKED